MPKEMLINVSAGEECRIALLNDGRLEELYMERTSSTSHVGNIYKGRVTNVEPSIQAAFVDFGLGRNGFLHISDLMPTYFGRQGEDIHETVGRKMARRDRPPIQRCLRRGDEIIVQIIKEGIGTKGPTLSTYLSIPGKMLVMMPGMGKMGVSKKIEDDQERRRLRQILDSLKPPKDVAFIIRTAGVGKTKLEIERDLKYLTRLWEILKKKEQEPGPVELYTEGDLVTRTVRDLFSADVERIVVDDKEVCRRVKEVIKISSPRAKNRCDLYEDPVPLFHKAGIEQEIEMMYSRHVPLPGGGSLVIDSTEAVVAIDVNSGKFRDHNDAEMTAFKTDMEAADEIPRQLKLRDLGGVIICDFIDLRYERHRRELEERLFENFKNDRAKTKVLRMSQFGIIEITRQRMRPSLKRSIYFDCPHCKGAGLIKTPESISLDVMRKLAIALNDQKVIRAELSVCPDVAFYLLNKKREALTELEKATQKKILIRTESSLALDELKFSLFDIRDGMVILEEIGMSFPDRAQTNQPGNHSAGHTQQNRGGRQGGQRGQKGRRNDSRPLPTRAAEADREEMDEDRAAVERGDDIDDTENQQGFGGARPEREEDPTDIPAILETQNSDEVEEFSEVDADEESGDEAGDEASNDAGDEAGDASGEIENRPSNRPPQGQQRQPNNRNAANERNGPRQEHRPQQNRPQQGGWGNQGRQDRARNGQSRNDQPRNDQGRNDRGRNEQGSNDQGRNDRGRNEQGSNDQGRNQQPRSDGRFDQNRGGRSEQNRQGAGGQNQPRPPQGQPVNRGPESGQPQGEEGQGGRRRRRRGRRGRGRGNNTGEFNGEPNGNVRPGGPDEDRPMQLPQGAGEFEDHDFNADPEEPQFTIDVQPVDVTPEAAPAKATTAGEGDVGEEQKPRRRRRRGGRRHRRRGPGNDVAGDDNQDAGEQDEFANESPEGEAPDEESAALEAVEEPAAIAEPIVEIVEVEPEVVVKPKAKRTRVPAKGRAAAPKRVPPKKASKKTADPLPEVKIATKVVRTGSADKHLVGDDEPVASQPLPRPHSYRDLDAIPDDYD